MKKSSFVVMVLGTVSLVLFALGMCMCLIPEWDLFNAGVVVATLGFIILLCIIPVYKSNQPSKPHKPVNFGLVMAWVIGIIGALVMGFGMSKTMVDGAGSGDMLMGIIFGIIGLIVCVLDYPVYSYLKKDKDN